MKRFTLFLLLAIMSVPFMQSCNTTVEKAEQVALATIHPAALTAAGFYGELDNGDKIYPGAMRVKYEPKLEPIRAIIYFKELDEPVSGFEYNADIFGITELTTKNILTVKSAEADTLKDGIEIVNAYIGGGYINIEFNAYIDAYNPNQHITIDLQDFQMGNTPENGAYYPLTLGFKCYPKLESGTGYLVSSVACFRIGDEHMLENIGCTGYELKYRGLIDNETENLQSVLVKPEANKQ